MFSRLSKKDKRKYERTDYSSDDSVDRAMKSEKKISSKAGKSSFRQKDGTPMYLLHNASGSNHSIKPLPYPIEEDIDIKSSTLEIKTKDQSTNSPYLRPKYSPAPTELHTNSETSTISTKQATNLEIPTTLRPGSRNSNKSKKVVFSDYSDESHASEITNLELIELKTDTVLKSPIETNDSSRIRRRNLPDISIQRPSPELNMKRSKSKAKSNRTSFFENFTSNKTKHHEENLSSDESIDQIIERGAQVPQKVIIEPDIIEEHSDEETTKQVREACRKELSSMMIKRVFINPELDLLNRFCLEYISITVRTEQHGILTIFKVTEHYKRVFDFMETRIESVSTPIISQTCGPEVPILLTRLFLNQFRIRSRTVEEQFGSIPFLYHNNKMTLNRFTEIVKRAFNRKNYYERRLDIARHGLNHIV